MKRTLILIVCIISVPPVVNATRLLVPSQYTSIQAAINATSPHDTVLVSPGTYNENINFRAKGIVLASTYILTNDTATIDATIINGSQPANPDSASCVMIASKLPSTALDTNACIIGFKITGGTGTKWEDEHNPGNIYREGGGILVQYLSPRILHNHITYNHAINVSGGMASAGGGAIRCGDSNPLIQNNVIDNNQGKYGAGIVFNYCGGMIRNNLIAHNTGGQDFGGSGVWILGANAQGSPRNVVNNTIIYNYSTGPGGGIWALNTTVTVNNNILWGNTASTGKQIYSAGSTVTAVYNDIQDGYTGAGNIKADPMFDVINYYLLDASPCIDKGDSTTVYNDIPDPVNPSSAKFPSNGSLRNDMGAYGGPKSTLLSSLSTLWTSAGPETNQGPQPEILIMPNPVSEEADIVMHIMNENTICTELFDMNGHNVRHLALNSSPTGDYRIRFKRSNLSPGNYWLVLTSNQKVLARKSLIIN
ncbi:MAG: T9SS type A sorting domain-containing protein [Bacteroidetes bacterium]|nr:T9SS type A sorting domain-containing protein [Bacteroidota bacterium]